MSDESNPDGPRYHVFLAQPNAGSVMPCCALGMLQATFRHKLHVNVSQFGALVHNFNMCWCEALNRREELGLTHFAMLHSDIKVSPSWIDALIEEMDRVDAEVMSAVVAIKDSRGLTTTGIRYADTIGCRRFTMREIVQLPETFSIGLRRPRDRKPRDQYRLLGLPAQHRMGGQVSGIQQSLCDPARERPSHRRL